MWPISFWPFWITASASWVHIVSGSCRFPEEWRGHWLEKGAHFLHIEADRIPTKGICRNNSNDYYLLEDTKDKDGCFRCIVIYEKHTNVLQYKETLCDVHSSLDKACARLHDADLTSLFRKDAAPESCPFSGPFTFKYRPPSLYGTKECGFPVSHVDKCSEESRLYFTFEKCTNVSGSEKSEEELTCLASWKEGSKHYMVGLLQKVNFSTEPVYRCFVYATSAEGYQLAQSADATCYGLESATVGPSRTITLIQSPPAKEAQCDFPREFEGLWSTLDGQTRVEVSGKEAHIGPNLRLLCLRTIPSSANTTIILAHAIQRCRSGYMCVSMHLRDTYIAEIQLGRMTTSDLNACTSPNAANRSTPFLTIYTERSEPSMCPQLVETNGLRIQAGRVTLATAACQGAEDSALERGCVGPYSLQFLTRCAQDSKDDLTTFQCHGMWEEEGRTYLIAGSEGAKTKYCLVYHTFQDVTHMSGLPDSCHRAIQPGITGNFTFNITAAGECESFLSGAVSLLEGCTWPGWWTTFLFSFAGSLFR